MPDAQDRHIALLLYDNPTSSNALKARLLLAGSLLLQRVNNVSGNHNESRGSSRGSGSRWPYCASKPTIRLRISGLNVSFYGLDVFCSRLFLRSR